MKLTDGNITLRALEPEDIETLYLWENDPEVWGVSGTQQPFSRHVLRQFIDNQMQDIYQTRQCRFIIDSGDGRAVGAIDLFDFDPTHSRAGIGILIYSGDDRGHGYASSALRLLSDYAAEVFHLHQLYCSIPADNTCSVRLFELCEFEYCGTRKEWIHSGDGWVDELLFQKILR